jgi:C-terminal processing protease CtpA/Prc
MAGRYNPSAIPIAVRPESDAASKGLAAGDQVLSVNGIRLTREDSRYIDYAYGVFPQSGLHLEVRSPDGVKRSVVAASRVVPGQPVVRGIDVREYVRNYHAEKRSRYFAIDKKVLIWKLPDFLFDPGDSDELLDKARSYETVILDLRGNHGGLEETAGKIICGFFNHDVKIADKQGRQASKPVTAKSRGSRAVSNKLIVLIDSTSASASEILARVVQLERRGTVIGDGSAGAVTEAKEYIHAVSLDPKNVSQYGTQITVANLVHSDGQSLERVGVTPDERIVPTPQDLRTGHDPVLARAVELAGAKMTPEEAGKVFPFLWPKKLMPEYD